MAFRRIVGSPRVAMAGLLIVVIAVIDWRVDLNFAFAFLYLLPILLAGTVLLRWQVVLTALLCTFLSDFFDPFRFTVATSLPQDILVFAALAGCGLFAHEVTRRSRREAADRLLGLKQGELPGKSIRKYIPALGRVSPSEPRQTFRTEMQCRGVRSNGEVFLANVFFSTYNTAAGPRLAAMVVDASEDLRDREESNLEQLLAGSRILVGAVSHEVRNVCGAIAIMHENLVRSGVLSGNQDFEALGSLVETLNRIASMELTQSSSKNQAGTIDLSEALDDLRIVLEPCCHEADIAVHWDIPDGLPPVWADRHRLLQVLLNLTKNSERALRDADVKRIDISASAGKGGVSVRVTDTGPGISSVPKLFQPFQQGAESTGLGLYLSRAFVRSFRGELRHDPSMPGCSFVIELAVAGADELPQERIGGNGTNTAVVDR